MLAPNGLAPDFAHFLLSAPTVLSRVVAPSTSNRRRGWEPPFEPCATVPVASARYDDGFFRSSEVYWPSYIEIKKSYPVNIAFVGRMMPNKRPDKLIEMAAKYKGLFVRPLCVHLVGKICDENYVARLMDKAAHHGILSMIRMHVAAPRMQLKTVLAAADAFVSFSEHEGLMVPLLEASRTR